MGGSRRDGNSMMRRMGTIAVFLLIGAAVNVGIAWSLAIWTDSSKFMSGSKLRNLFFFRSSDQERWGGFRSRGRGGMLVYISRFKGPWEEEELTYPDEGPDPEFVIPPWTGLTTATSFYESAPSSHEEERIAQFWGFPMLCMWQDYAGVGPFNDNDDWQQTRGWEITLPGWIESSSWPYRVLPLRPIWPGFAVNTAIYATLAWLMFRSPFALRCWRRRRRHCCVKCGYDLRGLSTPRCPECGTMAATAAPRPSPA